MFHKMRGNFLTSQATSSFKTDSVI